MNDSKNMILAVVLSALVLLGWTWAANRYFPTANPPSTKVENGKPQPVPAAAGAAAARRQRRRRCRPRAVLGSSPRVRIETPSLQGSINLKGAQIDDLVAGPPARRRSPRIRRRCGCCRRSARRAPISPSSAGPARTAGARRSTRCGPRTARRLTPGQPVTLSDADADGARYQIKIAVDDGYLFTVQQTRRQRLGASRSSVRPIGLVSRASKSTDPSTLDQPRRPDRRVRRQGQLRRRLEGPRRAGKTETFNNVARLARLHRQILADRAGSRRARMSGEFRAIAERRLPGRLCRLAGRRSRPGRR